MEFVSENMKNAVEQMHITNLQRVDSHVFTPAETYETFSNKEPPNGGLTAWLQVTGSFFLFFNSWGIINTFGIFQTYYETTHLGSSSDISWIGSIQTFLLLLVGAITGPLYDAGYFRHLTAIGTSLITFGLMMTSLCSQYWQVMLAQAFFVGLGCGCLFIPSVAILPQYFTTKKALAIGIAASGSSLGGVLYPIIFTQILPRIGFGWATRVLGFISLATCAFAFSVMHVAQFPIVARSLLELGAFREAPYSLFCVAMFLAYVGFFGPIFYLQSYAIQRMIMSEDFAFFLLPMLNAASIPGRILIAFFAGKLGVFNMLLPTAFTTGILSICWIWIDTASGLIAFASLYGFFSGGFVSLPAVALTSLTPDIRTLGTRMGMNSVICSFGSLCGPPICGFILQRTDSYLGVQLFSGITILLTGFLMYIARFSKVGGRLNAKF